MARMSHAWTEYPNGAAHCPKCGSVRLTDGTLRAGDKANELCPPPRDGDDWRRIADGIIIVGPPS